MHINLQTDFKIVKGYIDNFSLYMYVPMHAFISVSINLLSINL